MKKAVHISILSLYIINAVRKARLELGLSQRDVSRILYPESSTNLIGGIESDQQPDKYNDDHLNKIAKAFTKIARELQSELDSVPETSAKIKTEYTIFNFYPPEPLPEGEQIKTIEKIPKELRATGTLNLLLEQNDPFILQWRSVREITDHCNSLIDKNWKSTDFTAVLDRAEKKGKLIKSEEDGTRYRKA